MSEQVTGVIEVIAKTGGLKLEGRTDWLNPAGLMKDYLLSAEGQALRGQECLITLDGGRVSEIKSLGVKKKEIMKEHIINLKGKEFITLSGLLDIAHPMLKSIQTELIFNDYTNNTFITRAVVTLKNGNEFSAYGDATPKSVGNMILPHALRMSESRAIARALRWATNTGMCSVEEISEELKESDTND